MRWHCLGHACWLAEVGALRVLFDPLLFPSFRGGAFETFPRRRVRWQVARCTSVQRRPVG